jgi:valyl-tRNA synthetase
MKPIPEKYDPAQVESAMVKQWEAEGLYHYSPNVSREKTYVVDTPPPTVSGSLHIGHVFSYTQTDILARFQRMQGKNVFYPMGWDDNGLPTERRVQNLFGITCDPTLPYDAAWKPVLKDDPKDKRKTPVSRRNFLEACSQQTAEDEKRYEELWRHLGLSIDWRQQYATIDEHCRRVSQMSYLDLVKKGLVYNIEAPTLWDTGFQTAVAQAEVEDRIKQGAYHDIRFETEDGEAFEISTTRPELLAACIAVVAHPDDERFKKLFGRYAITPLFRTRVPILAAEHADPEKGTGILMVCTFGDAQDVEFWKRSKLPLRQLIGRDGRFMPIHFGENAFESTEVAHAQKHYDVLKGLYVNQARAKTVELLKADESAAIAGRGPALVRDPKATEQAVKFYEKGDQPLEFISTRQWFVKILEHKEPLLEQGRKVSWHPDYMLKRYEQWVQGLNQDWCISRQRYFGVAFPVWYSIDAHGVVQYTKPIYAAADKLPIDPLSDAPAGYSEDQRGKPGGFSGDPDVMDTWATSSVSPQISSHWQTDPERHKALFPADLRPQAHEIIRTWAFYTITKSWMHEKQIPWKNIAISGWVVDPNREKMSKSKGNIVTPQALIEKYSSDAIRYWAGRAKLGQDTIFDESVFSTGKRLATKVFNASRFVMMQIGEQKTSVTDITAPVDLAWIELMRTLVDDATKAFERYDYGQALIETEQRFWDFCDNYLELVKARAYQQREEASGRSAIATLEWSLNAFLRLLAPFTPFVCEEVWSWRFKGNGRDASVHTTAWPVLSELAKVAPKGDPAVYGSTMFVLNRVRGTKSSAQKSLKWPVASLSLKGPEKIMREIRFVEQDLREAGQVLKLDMQVKEDLAEISIDVVLGDQPQ